MKACLVNYNFSPDWLLEYPQLNVTLYDRSDDKIERDLTKYGKVIKTKNLGDVDYDKLGYLIENYDNLPDVFLWGKSNLLKYCDKEYFDKMLSRNEFAPLLKLDHKTYSDKFGVVCSYKGDMYYERADSWYFNTNGVEPKHFYNWQDWCKHFMLPATDYVPFAPGGNYLLTKERMHRYGRDFYEEMRSMLPHAQRPAEAHAAERSYYLMWK